MAVNPLYPVIYFRTINSTTVLFPTVQDLIDAFPDQAIELEDSSTTKTAVIGVTAIGQDNDVAEPVFSSDGAKSIFKQQVGAINEGITVQIMVEEAEYSKLFQMRTFSRQPNIEEAYHKFGNLGFLFPTASIFTQDPTNVIGYTLKPPIFEWGITGNNIPVGFVKATLNFSLGGLDIT